MKLTKKQEQEARKVYEKYWDSYTKGDIKGFSSTLDDAFEMIGTSESEVCHSKADGIKFYKAQMKELVGKAEMRNRRISVKPVNGMFLFIESCDIYILDKRKWTFYARIRISTLLHETKAGWKVIQQHGSFPDMRVQEGETIAFEKISKENLELRDAVKRATVELETKNRDLKTEAALERVRTVAMGMKKSADLLSVCKTGFRELKKLGFADLRNMIIHTYVDEQKYFNDYDYSDALGGAIAKVPYTGNPVIEKFIKTIRKGKSAFSEIKITGKQLEDWKKFRKANKEPVDPRLNKTRALYYYIYSVGSGSIGISTFSPVDDEKRDILIRFRNVFDLSYQRYLDIQNAEAQAREAQIQLALERVRARTMAMHRSDELTDVVKLLYQEFDKLKLSNESTDIEIGLIDEETGMASVWAHLYLSDGTISTFNFPIGHFEGTIHEFKKWKATPAEKRNELFFTSDISGKHLKKLIGPASKLPGLAEALQPLIDAKVTRWVTHNAYFSHGLLTLQGTEPYSAETLEIQKRFAKVFEQTYTRFLDLQKAEAQAREAQVETALEKVRSRSLAMHRSDELEEVIMVVSEQLQQLQFRFHNVSFGINNERQDFNFWMASPGVAHPFLLAVPYIDNPALTHPLQARSKGVDFISDILSFEENKEWLQHLFAYSVLKNVSEENKNFLLSTKNFARSQVLNRHTILTIGNYAGVPYTDEQNVILKRFGNVFEQAYTRFLDLQKAEEQAREAQIEAALEKVRSRTMAMQRSEELPEAANTLFLQVQALGIPAWSCGYNILSANKTSSRCIMSSEGEIQIPFTLPLTEHESFLPWYEAVKNDEELFVNQQGGTELAEHYRYMKTLPELKPVFEQFDNAGISLPTFQINHLAKFKEGFLLFITYEPVPEAHDIFKRFAKVFEQTYTRFLDLQKAEAQAREAEIQLALERVRARSLAMHKTDELQEVVNVVAQQLLQMGIDMDGGVFIAINNEVTKDIPIWAAAGAADYMQKVTIPFLDRPTFTRLHDAIVRRQPFYTEVYSKKDKNEFLNHLFRHHPWNQNSEERKKELLAREGGYVRSVSISQHTTIGITNHHGKKFTDAENDILRRFGAVLEQSYTRFLDLQKAEAQAREAQIEAALERVRSRSMAMHKSEELSDLSLELVKQVQALGVATWFCAFNIYDDDPQGSLEWGSNGQGVFPRYRTPREGVFLRYYEAGQRGEKLLVNEIGKDECPAHYEYLCSLPGVGEQLLAMKEAGVSFPVFQIDHVAFFKYGYILFITYEPVPETHDIFKRFARVFEQTYTRFLDLQKAEAQAREAQIEAALERVRARTMAMQKSTDLGETSALLFGQLNVLVPELWTCGFVLCDKNKTVDEWWLSGGSGFMPDLTLPNVGDELHNNIYKAWLNGESYYEEVITGEALQQHYDWLMTIPSARAAFDAQAAAGIKQPVWQQLSCAYFSRGYLVVITEQPCNETQIFKRFAQVFEQTYTRFLDLQKAEAQAREAQIEAALERIRGKVTSMQESSELLDIVVSMRSEFVALSHEAGYFWYMRWLPDKYEKAMTSGDGSRIGMVMTLPRHIHGDIKLVADWEKSDEPALVFPMDADTAVEYVDKMISLGDFQQVDPQAPTLDDIRHIGGLTFIMARTTHGEIGYSLAGVVPNPPEEDVNTLVRFAAVFDLAYRRFEDLKEAERRNRETQIELALERVRSRTMAMHKSAELKEVIKVVLEQFVHLNINVEHAGFYIDYKANEDMHIWLADPNLEPFYATFPYFDTPTWNSFRDAKAKGKNFFTDLLDFEEKNKFYQSLFKLFTVPEDAKKFYLECKGLAVSTVLLDNVGLYIENFDAVPYSDEENNILMRFGKVFQQTYTRFLDLQKAEAQAREAEIELGLERVRARAMAMQNSDQLKELIGTVFTELTKLDLTLTRCIIWIFEPATQAARWWMANSEEPSSPMSFYIKYHEHPAYLTFVKEWEKQNVKFVYDLNGNDKIAWDDILFNETELKQLPEAVKKGMKAPERVLLSGSFNNFGGINVASLESLSDEHFDILLRFAKVFDLTYTRFNDLQKAEAQAREAQIEAALEKVRSRSLAMQQPNELREVAELLRKEMGQLGVEELETSSIYIVDKENVQAECWYAIKDIRDESKNLVSDEMTVTFADTWVGNEMGRFYRGKKEQISIVMKGDKRKEWINYCAEKSKVLQGYYGDEIPERTYHLVKFNGGYMGAASPGDISAESWDLLRRAASVFSLAYTRFSDLKIAEAHAMQAEKDLIAIKEAKQKAEEALGELQATQKQLIQSEKMASLGELTAGIAHEIQNPLNFVNNFSEVSKELLDEIKEELEKGNVEDAKEIMNDVIQNLEKINHHGKRADGIVKGMLQHSRSSSGQKEPTDINALCDEYLRLAYHGLRAKDKNFNAKFEASFDETIGKINILPQDLGRVVLNLINNAFYAVSERKNAGEPGYEPAVTVSTQKAGNVVEINVRDNGTGIPQKALDKIFQPFFTTKPTGQGTGLGLSLSYDIVTKGHGGELKVETKEGEGTTFMVVLPV